MQKKDAQTGQTYDRFVREGRVGDGKEFVERYFSTELKERWMKDSQLAMKRWRNVGVEEELVQRYLC